MKLTSFALIVSFTTAVRCQDFNADSSENTLSPHGALNSSNVDHSESTSNPESALSSSDVGHYESTSNPSSDSRTSSPNIDSSNSNVDHSKSTSNPDSGSSISSPGSDSSTDASQSTSGSDYSQTTLSIVTEVLNFNDQSEERVRSLAERSKYLDWKYETTLDDAVKKEKAALAVRHILSCPNNLYRRILYYLVMLISVMI